MPSAATLRRQIELELESRFPAALSPTPAAFREVAATGIAEVDRLLDGGFPVGAISEIVGPVCSGRTTLALAFLAERTAESRFCAWVDASDALDPESAAASGVQLQQLLWVRCSDAASMRKRNEGRAAAMHAKPWTRLDQALRATDLLLQAGGFAAIVLDLGEIAPEHGSRIPLATWFRFRQAADRTRASLLVLGLAAYAQSSAAVVLECSPMRAQSAGGAVLSGCTFAMRRERQRSPSALAGMRKPPASTWSASVPWQAEKRA
jgi:hypothetical protein